MGGGEGGIHYRYEHRPRGNKETNQVTCLKDTKILWNRVLDRYSAKQRKGKFLIPTNTSSRQLSEPHGGTGSNRREEKVVNTLFKEHDPKGSLIKNKRTNLEVVVTGGDGCKVHLTFK